MQTFEETLKHFGIRGMKWGVRRPRGPEGTVRSLKTGGHANVSEDAKKAHDAHKKVQTSRSTDPLSNPELQHLVNRINLEQQYIKLTTPEKSAGAKIAKDVLVGVGKQQASKLASDAATKAISKSLKK